MEICCKAPGLRTQQVLSLHWRRPGEEGRGEEGANFSFTGMEWGLAGVGRWCLQRHPLPGAGPGRMTGTSL